MNILRQSTASQEIVLGPFVDSVDGNTEEVSLTIANTDIKIWKSGATTLANKNSGGGTHISNGVYSAVLDATDTDTLGPMTIFCHPTGALATRLAGLVLSANLYDSIVAASDKLQVDVAEWLGTAAATPTVAGVPEVDITHWLGTAAAAPTVAGVPEVDVTHWIGAAAATPTVAGVPEVDVTHFGGGAGTFAGGRPEANASHIAGAAVNTAAAQIGANVVQVSGDAVAADNLETALDDTPGAVPWTSIVDQGTAQSATDTTLVLRAAAGFADDELNGATIVITGGTTGVGQRRIITDYTGASDTATVDTWTVTLTGTITYKIVATAPAASAAAVSANVTQWLGTAVATPTVAGVPEIDVTHWSGIAVPTTEAGGPFVTRRGTALGGGASSITLDAGASAIDNFYKGGIVEIIGGTGVGQAGEVIGYVGSSKVATIFGAWIVIPDATSIFRVFAGPLGATIADINTAIEQGAVGTNTTAIKAKTDNLPATPAAVGSAMTLTSTEREAGADMLIGRQISGGASGGRTVGQALGTSRNRVVIDRNALTFTVYQIDDTTPWFSGTLTVQSGALPLMEINPS